MSSKLSTETYGTVLQHRNLSRHRLAQSSVQYIARIFTFKAQHDKKEQQQDMQQEESVSVV